MKIRERRTIVVSKTITIEVRKKDATYRSKYVVTRAEVGGNPESSIQKNWKKAVEEIKRLLTVEGWTLSKIRKL